MLMFSWRRLRNVGRKSSTTALNEGVLFVCLTGDMVLVELKSASNSYVHVNDCCKDLQLFLEY